MNNELKQIFLKAISAVNPVYLVKSIISKDVNTNILKVKNKHFILQKNCYLIGFGKAVYEMAIEIESILGNDLQKGIVSVPVGIRDHTKLNFKDHSCIKVIEGGKHNLADENSFKAAQKIKILSESLKLNDILIVLISGGGSALLSFPVPPVSLNEKNITIKSLIYAGANIVEVNCVRKVLSLLKGGKLASLAYPATVISLILSDVVDDVLDVIASGPTVQTNYLDNNDALQIIEKYGILHKIPETVKHILFCERINKIKLESKCFKNVHNIIIGNNMTLLKAAKNEAEIFQYGTIILTNRVNSSVSDIAFIYSELIKYIIQYLSSAGGKNDVFTNLKNIILCFPNYSFVHDIVNAITENIDVLNNNNEKLCLIAGGEPVINVKGNGKGGRNLHLALEMNVKLNQLNIQEYEISFVSAGTDGIDGPTDAAGAIINNTSCTNLNFEKFLKNFDSYNFFHLFNKKQMIITGHTGTNVMDLHMISIIKK